MRAVGGHNVPEVQTRLSDQRTAEPAPQPAVRPPPAGAASPGPAAGAAAVDANYQYWRDHGGEWADHYDNRKKRQVLYHIQELMLTTYILEHAESAATKPLRVLEFGCGVGRHLRNLNRLPGVDVHGYDQSEAMAKAIARWAGKAWFDTHVRVGLPTGGLPFDDASFDIVYSAEVLVHVRPEHLDGILRQLVRVCRGHILHLETSEHTDLVSGEHSGCWRHDLPAAYARLGLACEVLPSGYAAHTPYRVAVKSPARWTWPPSIIEMYRAVERDIDEGFAEDQGALAQAMTAQQEQAAQAAAARQEQAAYATAALARIADVERALSSQAEVLEQARELLAAKDGLIGDLERAVASQTMEISNAAARITLFETRLKEVDAALAQGEELRAVLMQECAAVRGQYAEMARARDLALAEGSADRATLSREIAALKSQHAEMTAARDAAMAMLEAARAEAARVQGLWAGEREAVQRLRDERRNFIDTVSRSLPA